MSMPIRVRLTLWYVGVLTAVLLAFSAGVLWMQDRYSRMQFDTELRSVAMTRRASCAASSHNHTSSLARHRRRARRSTFRTGPWRFSTEPAGRSRDTGVDSAAPGHRSSRDSRS